MVWWSGWRVFLKFWCFLQLPEIFAASSMWFLVTLNVLMTDSSVISCWLPPLTLPFFFNSSFLGCMARSNCSEEWFSKFHHGMKWDDSCTRVIFESLSLCSHLLPDFLILILTVVSVVAVVTPIVVVSTFLVIIAPFSTSRNFIDLKVFTWNVSNVNLH